MKSVFTNTDVLDVEKKIISKMEIPSIILMENAGKNSADYIYNYYNEKKFDNIFILAGKGNNAGDAFVISRHLISKGLKVRLLLFYEPKDFKGDALTNYLILKNSFLTDNLIIKRIKSFSDFKKEDYSGNNLFVDAVFGIGFKGELEKRLKDIFSFINSIYNKKVISIDIVSGLSDEFNPDSFLNADVTLTMGVKKINTLFNTGKLKSGLIKVMNIGISEIEFGVHNKKKIYELEDTDVKGNIPIRNRLSHKYSSGKTFILGGSPGLSGAAYLSSVSALRIGCGAVILGIPESMNSILETKTTEVITYPLSETNEHTISDSNYKKISDKIDWSDVTLLGPGIGRNEITLSLIRNIIKNKIAILVIDADGLFALKDNLNILKRHNGKIILTPHYGEFSNLTGLTTEEIQKDLINISKSFAKKYKVILVLKNAPTIITDGDYLFINPTGKENLATIGSGDVLAGIISGLYAQTRNPLVSALLGVFIHGKCGDALYESSGSSSTLAGDLINKIPEIKMLYSDSAC
jgi:hydroxyethylthiazole kinase-like uncharacterized protein yjeF